jgi:hypothetical protein
MAFIGIIGGEVVQSKTGLFAILFELDLFAIVCKHCPSHRTSKIHHQEATLGNQTWKRSREAKIVVRWQSPKR